MKRTWIPPTVVFPAIAVGLLVLAFLYYYFPERIRREDALNRQAFRQLGFGFSPCCGVHGRLRTNPLGDRRYNTE
jgi:hypothetical protein